jgi:tetratricopeptide (TPR) repeat protein
MPDIADVKDPSADLQTGLAAADEACRRGDLDGALRLWANVRQQHPEALTAYQRPALALRETGRRDAAEPILAAAVERFPKELEPIWVYSILAQESGARDEAIRRFGLLLERFPAHRDSHLRIITLLHASGRFTETEERLIAALALFPGEPWFAAQYGWTALARRDPQTANKRFQACRERFPDHADAVIGGAVALRESGLMPDADALLASGIARFPTDSGVAHGYADHGLWMRTAGLLDWDQTLSRWETLWANFPTFERGFFEGIRVLGDAGRSDAAEALAARAVEQFPHGARLAVAFAKCAEDRQDWPELVRRFQSMIKRFPDHPAAEAGLGRALSLSGRDAEAEAALAAAIERFPHDADPAIEYAMIANRRGDWPSAVTRWSAAQTRFPDHRDIAQRLGEAQLRLVDVEDADKQEQSGSPTLASVAAMVASIDGAPDRGAMHQIVMRFESLGGDSERGGCEFGLFQREYGAEPLALLRWSTMRHFEIIPALEAEFEGVGLPENTDLVLGPPQNDPEYFTTDKRFGMRMHTFVRAAEVPFDTMYRQVCRRLQFLKDKLLGDLREAEKIFVYNSYPNDLDDEQIDRLFRAIRGYGDTTLLYVRSANDAHPEGTVIEREPGLLIGHIDSPTKSGRSTVGAQPWPAWAKICPQALSLWNARRDAKTA